MRRLPVFPLVLAIVATVSAAATLGLASSGRSDAEAAAVRGAVRPAPTPTGDPVAFVKSVVEAVVDDDYRRAWKTLHPAHQRIAPLDDYVACEWREPIPGRLRSISVLRVSHRTLPVAGVGPAVASTAVRMRIAIKDMATGEQATVTSTFHAVPVAGRWRWVLPDARYALYTTGSCRPGATSATAV
jgi:hypothetical protein